MANQGTEQDNFTTDEYGADQPNVWTLVKGHIRAIADKAVHQYHLEETNDNTAVETFKLQFMTLIKNPLSHVQTSVKADHGYHALHQKINGAVEEAVDVAIQGLNMTGTNSSVKESLITALDSGIEMDVINQVFINTTEGVVKHSNFFESLPIKDETIFVALVSMGIVIPIIFFTLLAIFFYKRRKEVEERRQEMLLRDQPEFSMDDYNPEDKFDEGVPDLDFKRWRI